MRRLSNFFYFIIIIAAAWCVSACASPLGTIDKDVSVNDFWLVPRRQVYNVGDYFNKNNDLWVFSSKSGSVEQVPVGKVELKLLSNPSAPKPDEYLVTEDTLRLLNGIGIGRKIIVVSYGEKTAEYSIEIMDPHNLTPDDPPTGDGESGFDLIWTK
jgi:hypothetical protein